MQPFEISPRWRINAKPRSRQFTLEYLQTPKKQSSSPRWRAVGAFGRISDVLAAFVSHALLQSDEELPVALQGVRQQVEEIMERLGGPELRIGGREV